MDSDSNSNQSHEMFSDDELATENETSDCLKNDVSFLSCSPSSIFNDSASTKQDMYTTAEIPKTPLSLGPFISKIPQEWTSDLETPELKRPIRHGGFSTGKKVIPKKLQTIDENSTRTDDLSITYFSAMDEIIPQTIPDQREKKHLDSYITNRNSASKFDKKLEIQGTSGINKEIHTNECPNTVLRYNSVDDFASNSKKSSESNINMQLQKLTGSNSMSVADRVMELKKLQEQRKKNLDYGYISNEVFTKTLISLENAHKYNGNIPIGTGKSFHNQSEFIPFSQISIEFDEKSSYKLNENYTTTTQDENFYGFSGECQDKSQAYVNKFHSIIYKENREELKEQFKFYDNLLGFTTHEFNKSCGIAKLYRSMYDKYLDDNYQLCKKRPIESSSKNKSNGGISSLSLPVDTGIKTACGDEIFIDIDLIYKSKSFFVNIENNLPKHSIDELVKNNNTQRLNSIEEATSSQNMIKNSTEHVISHNTPVDDAQSECMNISFDINERVIEKFDLKSEFIFNDKPDTNTMNGFKTARGINVEVSKKALMRANEIFNEEKMDDDKFVLPKPNLMLENKKVLSTPYNKLGRVRELSKKRISHDMILKTKVPFDNKNDSPITDSKMNPTLMGFQTGHGKSINISENALLKAKTVFAEEINNDMSDVKKHVPFHSKENFMHSSNVIQNSTAFKRKYTADDDTPAGRKKLRLGPDLQRRKLFCEIEEEDNYLAESILFSNNRDTVKTDRNIELSPVKIEKLPNNINITTNTFTNTNIVSDEVRESIAALLKDEESSEETLEQWSSNVSTNPTLKNRRSNESWNKCEKNFAKRSRSYPGSGVYNQNINDKSSDVKSLMGVKLPMKPPSPKNEDIPEDLLFDSPFLEDFSDPHVIEQNRLKRSAANIKQQELIELKKVRKINQIIKGSLLNLKSENETISLKDLFKNGIPVTRTRQQLINAGIDPRILSINSVTASDYTFQCVDFFGQNFINSHYDGIPIGDDAYLIPTEDNLAGIKEFKQCFLASPGVNPTLVPNGYVENHYRWIVWKLASMDRLNIHMSIKFLTPDRIMRQLKYRYDREIDRSQRPALRRILEKDDAPSRRLVLCVSQLFGIDNDDNNSTSSNSNQRIMELTDGWYSVYASIDYAMLDNIKRGKIEVGTKLMIYGAELINLDEGRYPLDVPRDVRLKIHTNSTRRVKWYTKLGYQRQCGSMEFTLNSINSNGGLIGKFSCAVARIYPIIYREKLDNGQFIDRNARCEEKIVIAHEAECQSRIDALCANTEGCTGDKWKKDLESRIVNSLPARRDVTPITKIKVANGDCSALITLWSGGEESQSIFRENTYITIYNSLASGKKLCELQITANRYTNFRDALVNKIPNRIIYDTKRIFTPLYDTYSPGFKPHYGEFDTVGVIVSIGPAPHGMKNFETVNLAYKDDQAEDTQSYYLSILFWRGIASYGFSDIITVGSFIACSNLEWRKNTFKSIPTAFCTERTVITRNPKQRHLSQPFEDLRARITNTEKYVVTNALMIQNEILKKSKPAFGPANENSNRQCEFKDIYSESDRCNTPNNSKFAVTSNSEPRCNMKSMGMKARIDKLSRYGPAPTLSPLHLAQTHKIALNYRSPLNRPSILSKPQSK